MHGSDANRPTSLALAVGLLTVSLFAATVAPAPGEAATSGDERAATATWQVWRPPASDLSIRLQTRGHEFRTQVHKDATATQVRATLELILKGDVLLRAEGFANPQGQSARAWLRSLPKPLRAGTISRVRGLPRGVTGVRIRMRRSPQTYAQDVLLIASPGARVRLICPDRDDKRARALLRAAQRGLELAAGKQRRRR